MKDRKIRVRWRPALLGLGMGLIAMTAVTARGAGRMARGVLGTEGMAWWAAGTLTVSALVSGLASLLDGGSAIDVALAAVGVLVVLLVLNLLLCEGQMEGLAVTALALAGGSGAAALLGMNRRRGGGCRRRR